MYGEVLNKVSEARACLGEAWSWLSSLDDGDTIEAMAKIEQCRDDLEDVTILLSGG